MSGESITPPPLPPVGYAGQSKTVKYSLTRADLLRWQLYLLCRNRVITILIVVLSLGLAWNDCRQPAFAAYSLGAKILYAIFLMGFMFCFVGGMTMLAMWITVMSKKYGGLLGEHELEIRDDGLVERTTINESVHRWAGFHKIVVRRRYLYIYVTDNNVHIVPRRFFASPQAEREFWAEIEKRAGEKK